MIYIYNVFVLCQEIVRDIFDRPAPRQENTIVA